MGNITNYVLKPEKERRRHLDLTSPCEVRTKHRPQLRTKRALLRHLGLENDCPNWKEERVCVRHQCHNTLCSNPFHLVLGTYQENDRERPDRKGRGHNFDGHRHKIRRRVKSLTLSTGEWRVWESHRKCAAGLGVSEGGISVALRTPLKPLKGHLIYKL